MAALGKITVEIRGFRAAVAVGWILNRLPWMPDRFRVGLMNWFLRRFVRMRVEAGPHPRWEPLRGITAVIEREVP